MGYGGCEKIRGDVVGSGVGGQGGCERRIEVFCENSKNKSGGGGGGGGAEGVGSGRVVGVGLVGENVEMLNKIGGGSG